MWRWITRQFARVFASIPYLPALLRLPAEDRVASTWLEGTFNQPRIRGLFGRTRHRKLDYRLYLPTRRGAATRIPLLVMLHGCTQDAAAFAAGTRMNSFAEKSCFAVLYPQQSRKSNYWRCWNWFEAQPIAGEGEAALITCALTDLLKKFPIDRSRVFVAGMSAGGAMAALLAARHGRYFAACAIHSGVMYGAATSAAQALSVLRKGSSISPAESARLLGEALGGRMVFVPTIVIHGSDDEAVNPINGTQIVEQLCAVAEELSPAESCVGGESVTVQSAGGHRYSQRDFTQGGRTMVRSIVVEGLGHAWSGGDPRYEFHEAGGPDASQLIAEFVLNHRRVAADSGNPESRSAPARRVSAG